jgi:L-proline amide hydrolase
MPSPTLSSTEALAAFTYPNPTSKSLTTWYRIFGTITSSSPTPLIIIHGGPGLTHDLLLYHTDLATQYSIPVIFYNQIGSGRSTHLPETKDIQGFWTEEIFIAQLEQLIDHLALREDGREFDVPGSSWGGMLSSRWAARRPQGLRRRILASAAASKELSIRNCEK